VHLLTKTIVACAALTISILTAPLNADRETSTTTTITQQTTTVASSVVASSVVTTSTVATILPYALCGEWWHLASSVGFDDQMMPTLDQVMWQESRCDAMQHNASDPNGGSYGLTQINAFWCQPSKYYPTGYLQSMNVLTKCDDLYNPAINLIAAYELTRYSVNNGDCEWRQWAWVDDCD